MSPDNFVQLQTDHPEFAEEWAALTEWFAVNLHKYYVELVPLQRAMPRINRVRIILAMSIMVDVGMVSVVYRVRGPGGYLLEGEFSEPDQIPDFLPDRGGAMMIPINDGELVSGFRWGSRLPVHPF